MDGVILTYQCGCEAEAVGQAFEHVDTGDGVPRLLMVCPEHKQPTAPFERPAQPWRGRATIELELEAVDLAHAQRYLEGLVAAVNLEPIVRASTDSLVDLAGVTA